MKNNSVFIEHWCYTKPDLVPDKNGNIVIINKLSFGPLEIYEWGIDFNNTPYERYEWVENDFYISGFKVISGKNKIKKYIFYSAWYDENGEDKEVLSIEAEKMEIFQVGIGAEINSAIFDVGLGRLLIPGCLYINNVSCLI